MNKPGVCCQVLLYKCYQNHRVKQVPAHNQSCGWAIWIGFDVQCRSGKARSRSGWWGWAAAWQARWRSPPPCACCCRRRAWRSCRWGSTTPPAPTPRRSCVRPSRPPSPTTLIIKTTEKVASKYESDIYTYIRVWKYRIGGRGHRFGFVLSICRLAGHLSTCFKSWKKFGYF